MAESNEIFLREVGKRIRDLREAQKLTLEDMDFHTGIDASDFNKIEQGKTNITLKTLLRVSRGLKVEPKVLLDIKLDLNKD